VLYLSQLMYGLGKNVKGSRHLACKQTVSMKKCSLNIIIVFLRANMNSV